MVALCRDGKCFCLGVSAGIVCVCATNRRSSGKMIITHACLNLHQIKEKHENLVLAEILRDISLQYAAFISACLSLVIVCMFVLFMCCIRTHVFSVYPPFI